MNEYLASASFIDSDHPEVRRFAAQHASGTTERARAVALYYAVRDEIRYNPFLDFTDLEVFRASSPALRPASASPT
jgi:transglutaminase-like putative cysteine protease